jgi:hypothetical protein
MKNIVWKLTRVRLVVLSFLLTGLSVFSFSSLQAQSAIATNAVPQGNFVDGQTAILRLEAELESIQVLLESLNPNSQAYRTLNAKFIFFTSVMEALISAKAESPATVAVTISEVGSTLGNDAYGNLSKTVIQQLKQEIIELLQ